MPVDLSRIGLEGIETAQRTLNSMAQREALASQTAIEEQKAAFEAEDRAIDQWAVQALDSIGKGEGIPGGADTGLAGEPSDDPAAVFDTIGRRYLRAGAAKRGKEFIEAGIKVRKDIGEIDKQKDEQEQTRLENMAKAGDWVARNIGENESEYALFLSQLEDPDNPIADILGRENVAALKNTPWSPELGNYFKSKALSTYQQATLAMTERGQNRADKNLANQEARYKAMEEIARANLEERRKTEARLAKVGGPNVSAAPTNTERDTAFSAIINNVAALGGKKPEKDTPERVAIDNMTDDIVGRAKVIVAENKGLTFPEAVEQAVAESEAAGDFEIVKTPMQYKILGFIPGPKNTVETKGYKRKGTKTNPLALPASKAELIPGRYYKAADGTIEQYNP